MARIAPLSQKDAPTAARPLIQATEERLGRVPESVGIQAHCPPILEASQALGSAPKRSGVLPDGLISLVCLRVAQIVTCPM